MLSARKQNSEAARAYAHSAVLAIRGGDAVLSLQAAANSARAEIDLGSSKTHLRVLSDILEQTRALPNSSTKADLMIHLGRSFERLLDDPSDPRDLLRSRAAAAFREASVVAELTASTRAQSYALGYLGHLYELEGRGSEAMGLSRRALAAAGEASALGGDVLVVAVAGVSIQVVARGQLPVHVFPLRGRRETAERLCGCQRSRTCW